MQPNDTMNQIPYGYCQCGCGQKTKIADRTRPRYGSVKGQPYRYIHGHQRRKPSLPTEPNLCECGCGMLAPIAKVTRTERGQVKGQPLRFIHGHKKHFSSIKEAFLAYFKQGAPDECWPWTGYCKENGYGGINISGQPRIYAHRFSYEFHHGSIPDNLFVLHKCDNPPCCNPNHLFIGTQADNMQDMAKKGRHWTKRKSS